MRLVSCVKVMSFILFLMFFSILFQPEGYLYAQTGKVPNPPGTGPFSIQLFMGGTEYAMVSVFPPTSYTDGTLIPNGTPVQIKLYRSLTGQPGTFTIGVQIEGGGTGNVGQGAPGTTQKPYIDIKARTPVDCIEPRLVFLAATAVVNGVESPQTTNNLSYRYAVPGAPGSTDNCIPQLVRFPTLAAALNSIGRAIQQPPGGQQPPPTQPPPGLLPGGQPGGVPIPLPDCPFHIFAAGIRFGWAWSMAKWNLGMENIITHLNWAGWHIVQANARCSRLNPAWPDYPSHLSAIAQFINQMRRGNLQPDQIRNQLETFKGFSQPLTCQIIMSQLECNRETCEFHYFMIGWYLGKAQVALQVAENPGTPQNVKSEAKQEAQRSLQALIYHVGRLPQLGWPGFVWRCRNLSAVLPVLQQILGNIWNPNVTNLAAQLTQVISDVMTILGQLAFGTGQTPVAAKSIVLLIDLSGSMHSKPQGGDPNSPIKLDIAKQAASTAIQQMAPGTEAAVISFGISGCDVREELPFTQDKTAIEAKIKALDGNGDTPLADALYRARDFIMKQSRSQSVAIILLSDGQETCKGSEAPIQAAKDIMVPVSSTIVSSVHSDCPDGTPGLFGVAYAAELPQTSGSQAPQNNQMTSASDGVNPNPSPAPQTAEDLLGGAQVSPFVPPDVNEAELKPAEPVPGSSETENGPLQGAQAGAAGQQAPSAPGAITIHTIGFDLDPNSAAQKTLNEIAKIGGGQSHSAQNLSTLTQALTQTVTQQPATPSVPSGGGGGIVIPYSRPNWPLVLMISFLVGCVILVLAILIVRRGGPAAAGRLKVRASLNIYYSDGGRTSFIVQSPRTGIGRAPDNSLIINDPLVSTHHAEIIASESGFLLRDLGSANGTSLNGKNISQSPLYLGDEIKMGSTRLILGG
jgi:hypothetical protein